MIKEYTVRLWIDGRKDQGIISYPINGRGKTLANCDADARKQARNLRKGLHIQLEFKNPKE